MKREEQDARRVARVERGQRDRKCFYFFAAFLFSLFFSVSWCQVAGIPAPSYVFDGLTPPDIDYTNSTTSLSANWAPITQYVDGYECAIGTTPGGTDVVDWTNVGNVTSVTLQTPTLQHGRTYYFAVRGFLSVDKGEIAVSDGITVDTQPPSSQVNPLPATTNSLTFTVSWTGSDSPAGILNYDIQYRDGDTGAWTDWQMATTATQAQFTGENGHTYYFRCRARDNAGNEEDWPATYDTYTTIQVAGPPAPSYVNDGLTPPDIDFTNSTTQLSANWASVSGAYGYEVAIGTSPTTTDVLNWTDVGNVTSTTRTGLSLSHGRTYYFLVRAYDANHITGGFTPTDGITVDTQPPSSQVNPLSTPQSSQTFTVSWSGTDDLSGILNYDVQYRDGDTGAWTDWQMATTATQAQFTGVNGHTYYFRCRARDNAGNEEDWPAAPDTQTTIQVGAVTLTVVVTPNALTFSAGENSKDVTYRITATGALGVNLTALTLRKEYRDGTSEETPEVISQRIEAGGSVEMPRTITLDDATRTRVLAGGTSGTFDILATFSGNDDSGNAVSGSARISIEVRSGAPEAFTVSNLRIQFTANSPFAITQEVRARVLMDASGTLPGDVRGVIYLDGNRWRSFGVRLRESGENEFETDPLPTADSDVGRHTIRVEIVEPTALSAQANYEVSREAQLPTFTLNELILIADTAKLTNFNFPSPPQREGNTNRYTLNGTAKLTIISLDNQQVSDVTIENLKIEYNQSDPKNSTIRSGRVIKEVDETAQPLFKKWKDALVIRKVEYNYPEGSPTKPDYLSLSGMLHIPYLDQDIYQINDLHCTKDGIVGKDFHSPHEWNVYGFRFSIKDIGSAPAISIGKDSTGYYISISGELGVGERGNPNPTKIAEFSNFKFAYNRSTDDFNVLGTFRVTDPFSFIPGNNYFELTNIQFTKETDTWYFKVTSRFHKENLPDGIRDILARIPTPDNVEFKFSKDGNIVGKISLLNDLRSGGPGHRLDYDFQNSRTSSADPTEYRIPKIDYVLDLTYLGINLKWENGDFIRDQSSLELAADLYLPKFKDESGNWVEDQNRRRVQVGDVNASGEFTPGVRILMDGGVEWNAPIITVVRGQRFAFLDNKITLALNELAFQVYPFLIRINGTIGVDFSMIEGGITLGLDIDLDGNVDWRLGGGGHFDIVNVVHIGVDRLDFWGGPELREITLNFDNTTGEGTSRRFQQSGDQTIRVKRYFKFENASIDLGRREEGGAGSWFHGSVEQFLIYTKEDGDTKVSIRHADVNVAGIQILSDYDYHNPLLRVAGKATIPSGQEIIIVGKLGWGQDIGDMTFGFFGAVGGLTIQIGPVTLTDVGGGFFYNPVQEDLETVRYLCGFQRPEMDERIEARRPGGADNPGKFAVLLYAGAVIASEDLVRGKALITLTENYFNLDAEVDVLPSANLAKGIVYLGIGWDPFYAEGSIHIEVNAVNIITGNGQLDFYVYSSDAWGIMGHANLKVIRIISVTAELFVGNPGFMFDGKVGASINLYIVSGGFELETLFWYKRTPPSSWGAYAKGKAWGDVLGGLIGASISLEGALIHTSPDLIIYCVGGLKVEICWVTVFEGSVWVALSTEDGIDGGTGRNSRYDELIDEARNMANEMEQEKERVQQAMDEAKRAFDRLSEEQRRAAGATVIQPDEQQYQLVREVYNAEINRFGGINNLIPELRTIWTDVIDGTEAENLANLRTELLNSQNEIDQLNQQIVEKYNAVVEKINQYSAVLEAELPTIRELGEMGSPFQGYQMQTVTGSDGSTRTIRTGFQIDYSKAEQQANAFQEVRENSVQYQQRLLQLVANMEENLQRLDNLLHWEDPAVAPLASDFAEGFHKITQHYRKYIDYIHQNFQSSLRRRGVLVGIGERTLERQFDSIAEALILTNNLNTLKSWTNERIDNINRLLGKRRGEQDSYNPLISDSDPPERWKEVFTESGVELWRRVPETGLNDAIADTDQKRRDTANSYITVINDNFCPAWGSYTDSLDNIYRRKARLYEILYDLYDQLALCDGGWIRVDPTIGTSPDLPGMTLRNSQTIERLQEILQGAQEIRGIEGMGGPSGPGRGPRPQPANIGQAVSTAPVLMRKSDYFNLKKTETALYLVVPEITSIQGEVYVGWGYANISVNWRAYHPYRDSRYPQRSGVVECSWTLKRPVGNRPFLSWVFGRSGRPSRLSWYSVGKPRALSSLPLPQTPDAGGFDVLVLSEMTGGGDHELRLRVRGAGGYTIERMGRLTWNYASQGQRTSMNTEDNTPPLKPVVEVKGPFTASSGEMWGRWSSSDYESGIQEYQYKIVKLFLPTSGAGSQSRSSTYAYNGHSQPSPLTIGGAAGAQRARMGGGRGRVPGSRAGLEEVGRIEEALQPVDVIPWTSAGGMTEMNIRGLSLEHNNRYKLLVRAKNGVGLWSEVGESIPVKVDLTPPDPPYNATITLENFFGYPTTAPSGGTSLAPRDNIRALPATGTVAGGLQAGALGGLRGSTMETVTGGQAYLLDPSSAAQAMAQAEETPFTLRLSWEWDINNDGESGITGHRYAIGTAPDNTEILNWTDLPLPESWVPSDQHTITSISIVQFPARSGVTYYLRVRSVNGAGVAGDERVVSVTCQLDDPTPPTAPNVGVLRQLPRPTAEPSQVNWNALRPLRVTWTRASDRESGIVEYKCAVGRPENPEAIVPWTSVGMNHEFPLPDNLLGGTYLISVKAINGAGLETVSTTTIIYERPIELPTREEIIERERPGIGR
ncbi:hypothetical protein H5T87_10125 [bacterium]|nr:hypothetical protein [bacterium]